MSLNIISIKQLRENFRDVRTLLEEGEEFLLIYRSRPLAKIQPIKEAKKTTSKSKAELVEKLSGGVRLKSWTPERLNKITDSLYEKMLP